MPQYGHAVVSTYLLYKSVTEDVRTALPASVFAHGRPEPPFGVRHSTISEKSSPCLSEGIILTHMVPDLAKWQIRVGGVMVFGASKTPLNHPGVDLDDPMVPMPKDGAHRDGQILSFYVK